MAGCYWLDWDPGKREVVGAGGGAEVRVGVWGGGLLCFDGGVGRVFVWWVGQWGFRGFGEEGGGVGLVLGGGLWGLGSWWRGRFGGLVVVGLVGGGVGFISLIIGIVVIGVVLGERRLFTRFIDLVVSRNCNKSLVGWE